MFIQYALCVGIVLIILTHIISCNPYKEHRTLWECYYCYPYLAKENIEMQKSSRICQSHTENKWAQTEDESDWGENPGLSRCLCYRAPRSRAKQSGPVCYRVAFTVGHPQRETQYLLVSNWEYSWLPTFCIPQALGQGLFFFFSSPSPGPKSSVDLLGLWNCSIPFHVELVSPNTVRL